MAHGFQTHDVVEFQAGENVLRGVVRNVSGDALTVIVPRTEFEGEYETEDVYVETGQAYVKPDIVDLVGSPDTTNLHPQNYSLERHEGKL